MNQPQQPPVKINTDPKKKNKKLLKILLIVLGVLILVFVGYVVYNRYFAKEKNANTTQKSNKVANKLDGLPTNPDVANRHTLGIVIENHPEARPQVGLDKASLVYEAISEGGITRFLALYGPNDADKVGPVRSARTYFVSWISEYNAFFGHCGGNLDALDMIKADNILDLDQFAVGDAAYWREPQKGKATEHTMYTSTEKLWNIAKEKGWPMTADFTGYKFLKTDDTENSQKNTNKAISNTNTTTNASGENAGKITVNFSTPTYKVEWDYDAVSGMYLRTMGGAAHKDASTGDQLKAKNIIIQSVERWEAPTAINESGWAMKTEGTGNAIIISGGVKTEGTWKKDARTSRTIFYDKQGAEIQYTPGKFWVEIVPPDIFDIVKIDPVAAQ